jgi:hypothetical protein
MRRLRLASGLAATAIYATIGLALLWPALAGESVLSAGQAWAAQGPFPATLRVQVSPEGRMQSDQALQFAPWLHYAADAWAQDGRLPLWKATANCGAPLLGNGQSALLFPPNLLAIVLGLPEWAFAGLALVKLVGGMLGAWLLARHLGLSWLASLLCGLVFGLGGYQAVWVMHPHTNVSFLFPLLVLLADRAAQRGSARAVAGLGLVAGLQHLAGHPETAFHCQVAALGLGAARAWSLRGTLGGAAARRRFGAVAAGLGLGALLGAAQILPLIEYLRNSDALSERLTRDETWLKAFDFPLPTLTFLVSAAVAVVAARGVARSSRPVLAALLLLVSMAGVILGHMSDSWDCGYLLLFASDWLGHTVSYIGPPNYIERNGAYAGAALALAGVGLLFGRPRGVALAGAVGLAAGLMAGFHVPLLDALFDVLPGFHVAANMRLQLWALLAAAVLAALGLDALGRAPAGARAPSRALLFFGAVALGSWGAMVAGVELGWCGANLDPARTDSQLDVEASLGPRGDIASIAPGLAEKFEQMGTVSAASQPEGVVGWVWLPSNVIWAKLDYGPDGSSPALLVGHEDGPDGVRRYSFVGVVPPQAEAGGRVRARLVAVLGDGRIAASSVLAASNEPEEGWPPMPLRPAHGAGGRQALLLGVAALLAAWGLGARGALLAGLRVALVVPALLTLLPFMARLLPMLPREQFYPHTPGLATLGRLAPDGRIFSLQPGRFPREIPTWYDIRDAAGYDAIAPARIATLLRAAADVPDGRAAVDELPRRADVDRALLGLAAVAMLVDVPDIYTPLGADYNTAFLPRARLVTGSVIEPDDGRALELLAQPDFPRDTTVVLAAGEARPAGPAPGPPPRIVVDRPDRVVVEVEANAPAWLALADTHYPGWTARVDNVLRPIERANVALRAVEVLPGERVVEFRYDPLSVRAGTLLMLAGGLICAAFLVGLPRNSWVGRVKSSPPA